MLGVGLYALLLAHVYSYKEAYMNIGVTFAMSCAMKILIKKSGDIDQANLVGIGGGAITLNEFVKLLISMKKAGFTGNTAESNKFLGGYTGEVLDHILNLFK